MKKKYFFVWLVLGLAISVWWAFAEKSHLKTYPAQVSVCFTPKQNCLAKIVRHINQAKHSIYMQAYSFTSGKIARALFAAHQRGIKVLLILDKSNFNCKYFSYADFLIKHHLPVWDDYLPAIAHNKVIIFDKSIVETGSFNYTNAAQYRNTENVLFIHSKPIAKRYLNSWFYRQKLSKLIQKNTCKFNYRGSY